MGWVDYRKAYDMVPHTWINECLKIFKINEKLRIFLLRSMETWRTVLENGEETLGEVNIKTGIFQDDSLSPLLFVMAMIPLSLILRKANSGYLFKDKTKINHLLYIDDVKLF